jgi:hypothetical protein
MLVFLVGTHGRPQRLLTAAKQTGQWTGTVHSPSAAERTVPEPVVAMGEFQKESRQMTEATTELALKQPIEHDGKKIVSLKIRRPIVADMLAAQKVSTNEPERELNLIAVLTGLPRAAVEKLDMRDYMALQRKLAEFMKP